MGGVAVKASELAKTATTDKGLLPHLSDLVDLSENSRYCIAINVIRMISDILLVALLTTSAA
jgi:hypothetical protein